MGPTFVEGFSHVALEKSISRQRDIRQSSSKEKDVQTARSTETYLAHLDRVSELDILLADLTAKASSNATKLSSSDSNLGKEGIFKQGSEHITEDIQNCWEWVRQSIQLAELHVQNAGVYHKFHLSSDQLLQVFQTQSETSFRYRPPQGTPSPLSESRYLTNQMEERMFTLNQWRERVDCLTSQGRSLIPVHLRDSQQKFSSPRRGVWLCHYRVSSEDVILEPQEIVSVLDTTGGAVWKVRTKLDRTIEVPSIGCLIPGPDQSAIEKSKKLKKILYGVWKKCLNLLWPEIMRIFRSVVRDYLAGQIYVDESLRKSLMATLSEFDNTIVQRLGNPSGDANWSADLEICLNLLSKQQAAPKGKQHVTHVDDINQLRKLGRVFNDYVMILQGIKKSLKSGTDDDEFLDGNLRPDNETIIDKLLSPDSFKPEPTDNQFTIESQLKVDRSGRPGNPNRISRLYCQVHAPDSEPHHVSVFQPDPPTGGVNEDGPRYRSRRIMKVDNKGALNSTVRHFEVSRTLLVEPSPRPKVKVSSIENHYTIDRTTQLSQSDMKLPMKAGESQTPSKARCIDDFSFYMKASPLTSNDGCQTTEFKFNKADDKTQTDVLKMETKQNQFDEESSKIDILIPNTSAKKKVVEGHNCFTIQRRSEQTDIRIPVEQTSSQTVAVVEPKSPNQSVGNSQTDSIVLATGSNQYSRTLSNKSTSVHSTTDQIASQTAPLPTSIHDSQTEGEPEKKKVVNSHDSSVQINSTTVDIGSLYLLDMINSSNQSMEATKTVTKNQNTLAKPVTENSGNQSLALQLKDSALQTADSAPKGKDFGVQSDKTRTSDSGVQITQEKTPTAAKHSQCTFELEVITKLVVEPVKTKSYEVMSIKETLNSS